MSDRHHHVVSDEEFIAARVRPVRTTGLVMAGSLLAATLLEAAGARIPNLVWFLAAPAIVVTWQFYSAWAVLVQNYFIVPSCLITLLCLGNEFKLQWPWWEIMALSLLIWTIGFFYALRSVRAQAQDEARLRDDLRGHATALLHLPPSAAIDNDREPW